MALELNSPTTTRVEAAADGSQPRFFVNRKCIARAKVDPKSAKTGASRPPHDPARAPTHTPPPTPTPTPTSCKNVSCDWADGARAVVLHRAHPRRTRDAERRASARTGMLEKGSTIEALETSVLQPQEAAARRACLCGSL